MAGTLTAQVRNIAEVTTAVARGDLTRTITVEARGRSSSSRAPSTPWSTSSPSFADEVTRWPARSRLVRSTRCQADVHRRTWKDLTENVNMVGND